MVKLGFTGYTLFFLFLLKNIYCGHSLEPPRRGGSNGYQQYMFWVDIWKYEDDDEFRFNDASTHEGHLRQNGELTWFCNETIIMISHNMKIWKILI